MNASEPERPSRSGQLLITGASRLPGSHPVLGEPETGPLVMTTVLIIRARMGSSRLPGKTLVPIMGRPMLELMIERLQRARFADEIVVATTTAPEDDAIEALTQRLGVGCFRGSADDVLDRVLRAARAHDADLIVETTGDCPLIDPAVVDRVIETFISGDYDFVSNCLEWTYPRGLDTKAFPTKVLAEVAELTQDAADHEHVSLYIYEHPERYQLCNVAAPAEACRPDLRLTVDTPADLALIRGIFDALYPQKPEFGIYDVVRLLDGRPELVALNADIEQKAVR